jgi:hypothetical protein
LGKNKKKSSPTKEKTRKNSFPEENKRIHEMAHNYFQGEEIPRKRSFAWLWIILFILLIIIIVWLVVYFQNKSANNIPGIIPGTVIFSPKDHLFPSTDPPQLCTGNEGPVTLPLIYDVEDTIYRTTLLIGNDTKKVSFSVVPDTGSSLLLLNGPSCRQCDSSDGIFDPTMGTPLNTGYGQVRFGGAFTLLPPPVKGELAVLHP